VRFFAFRKGASSCFGLYISGSIAKKNATTRNRCRHAHNYVPAMLLASPEYWELFVDVIK